MAYRLIDRSDKLLARLDRQYGEDATYHSLLGNSVDVVTGINTTTYEDPISVRVRSSGLSSIELSNLSSAGLDHIDASWLMRHFYRDTVLPGHVLGISGFYYEVIDQGATLDDLRLVWTIHTRRRAA